MSDSVSAPLAQPGAGSTGGAPTPKIDVERDVREVFKIAGERGMFAFEIEDEVLAIVKLGAASRVPSESPDTEGRAESPDTEHA